MPGLVWLLTFNQLAAVQVGQLYFTRTAIAPRDSLRQLRTLLESVAWLSSSVSVTLSGVVAED